MDRRKVAAFLLLPNDSQLESFCTAFMLLLLMYMYWAYIRRNVRGYRNQLPRNAELRMSFLNSLLDNDVNCISQLRMDRRTFDTLCQLLDDDGYVKSDGIVTLQEQVCIFLHIIAHHTKNRTIITRFFRSGETISRYFNSVLHGVLRLHKILLSPPKPISDNCLDDRWKVFKNCLGALDGTYIKVNVPEIDKPRYRTRKGEIATNVLGVCNPNMEFIFVLPGWEGSASDSRVLRDALSRPNGLRVPTGCYYLVDAGYTNGEGFLAPYRGTRYHLSEWREGCAPINHEEYFNMKHASARNVIERCFGVLKKRWAILRSPSFYPIATQIKIITACCLIHNLIRREMIIDPGEVEFDRSEDVAVSTDDDIIGSISSSDQWTNWRNDLTKQMFAERRCHGH
ncbi:protein ALP1-like isoform X1 [Ziziphus jujuba]|uniref:Protein ALP1-like isoform X1 n=1 Tax=Ziziphus jujuba TaxID=326968 RepID=A0ABM4AHL5_ZIZJJ|nr:protein ALP1-like isoform X1 [Ziziphus jujuba]